jgi:hypothetical protein
MRAKFSAMGVELGAEDVAGTARMRQELMDGDLGGDVLVPVIGEVLGVCSSALRCCQLQKVLSEDAAFVELFPRRPE